MSVNLADLQKYRVFLNYPFDADFEPLANAMHFAVVAAGLLPVCAKDIGSPDRVRLDALIQAIGMSDYSIHDFSRCRGEGDSNFARFNMPLEFGMALFHSFRTQGSTHRCAFFVPKPHEYKAFASDLGGLDGEPYDDEFSLVAKVYEWLTRFVPKALLNIQPTVDVTKKYKLFKRKLRRIRGSGKGQAPTHDETQELIYSICARCKWWQWREGGPWKAEFPALPLSWKR